MTVHAKISPLATRVAEFPATLVSAVSEAVYRERLGERDTASMLAKDGDNGERLRERAAAYDPLTRSYLRAIEVARG
jgi:hypothetical protein